MTKHLIIPDGHSHYQHNNERASWLGKLILDERPDVVIDIGDSADMPSLSGYDKGKKTFQGRTYRKDVDHYLDFQDRIFHPIKRSKKRLPKRIRHIGNHEERINKAINSQPELDGAIGLSDLDLNRYYDVIVEYDGNTPGLHTIDGITYAHYFVSGNYGRPIGNEHPAYTLLTKKFVSCVQGHNHLLDYCIRTRQDGTRIMGLTVGAYIDYHSDWAGSSQVSWWDGVVILDNVEDGVFNLRTIDINTLKREYNE